MKSHIAKDKQDENLGYPEVESLSEAPALEAEEPKTKTRMTVWSRVGAHIIKFPFRNEVLIDTAGGKRVHMPDNVCAYFKPFFPGRPDLGKTPPHLYALHTETDPQVFRGRYITDDAEEIAFFRDACDPTGPRFNYNLIIFSEELVSEDSK